MGGRKFRLTSALFFKNGNLIMKQNTSFKYWLNILLLLVFTMGTSCSDENDELKQYITPTPESEKYFENGLALADKAFTQTISFETSVAWTASLSDNAAAEWCKLHPTKGNAGKSTIVVSVKANTGGELRSTSILLVAGNIQKEISVTQSAEEKEPETVPYGLSWSPEKPDADQPVTITFKADSKSALKGYKGNVYIHTGVIVEGEWEHVPAAWNKNLEQCKMTSTGNSQWSIEMRPSIREWFKSGETPVKQLGIVIRSEDGNKKGIESDSFIDVTDAKYQGFVPAEIKRMARPQGMKEGINYTDNGTEVTFVLYEEDLKGNHKDYAYIVGDFNSWTLSNTETSQMYRDDATHCWWITIKDIDPTKEYAFQYYLGMKDGETIRVADPYAEKVLDPDNDKYIPESTYPAAQRVYPKKGKGIVSVFKTAPNNYKWKYDFKLKDADNLMIYELHLRDFTETADLNGAFKKLDYIEGLGVNAIELMPVQEFDGNDSWGYNPCYFFAMDKAYGTALRYKEFIDECHRRGIAVILDVVYNHATGNMPFAKLYWDQAKNKTASDNPWFNVDAPHPYSVFHDFNHESALTRTFVKRNLEYLLNEYHVDGFRFDLTKGFTQRQCNESNAGNYDEGRIAILKDYYKTVSATKPEAVMILEHFCCDKEEKELGEAGMKVWRNGNNAYCQSGMGYKDNSSFEGLYTGTNNMPFGVYVGFMESHDEERTAYKAKTYGNGDLKTNLKNRMSSMAANAVFMIATPGPKMMWQFGEMGYDVSIEEGGRTGRKPLHWEYMDNADRKQLIDTYTRMMQIREAAPQLFGRNARLDWKVSAAVWNDCRTLQLESTDGKKLFIVGNFTTTEQTAAMAVPAGWTAYNDLMTGKASEWKAGQNIKLPPHSFVILGNENFK